MLYWKHLQFLIKIMNKSQLPLYYAEAITQSKQEKGEEK